jgi:CheY-like chemotaxis protein
MPDILMPAATRLRWMRQPTARFRSNGPRLSAGGAPSDDAELELGFAGSSASEPGRLPQALNGVAVLVVDDDEDTADLFAAALSACGAHVVATTSAREAIRMVGGERPDVIVTDIAMPGADGYWLLGEILGSPDARVRTIPVLAVTAFGREHVRTRTLASGFVDHLEKPVDPEALCVAVARAVGR